MKIAQSRLTSQGQVSVPAEVRKRLGVSSGSFIEWEAKGEEIIVRRGRRHPSTAVHAALFPDGAPPASSLADMKGGIRAVVGRRHARR